MESRERDARLPARRGLVMVFTGNGKGKTTAALGLALRAAGHDLRVHIVQFIKNKWRSGELRAIERLAPQVTLLRRGEGFTWLGNAEGDDGRHRLAAAEALAIARVASVDDDLDVLVLDEICTALNVGLIGVEEVIELVREKPQRLHIVLTGRGAPRELIELADTVTEMSEIKHHYHQGVKAQRGIEF